MDAAFFTSGLAGAAWVAGAAGVSVVAGSAAKAIPAKATATREATMVDSTFLIFSEPPRNITA